MTEYPDDTATSAAAQAHRSTNDDASYWANGVSRLHVSHAPAGALNLNVDGKLVTSPIQGFGKMWQKTYRIRLEGAEASPQAVIGEWKARFPEFWPPGNHFYAPLTGLAPGDVGLINLTMPGRAKLSTGVLVLYADDESFTLMTPQGHVFAGWITFSAAAEAGITVVQAQVLMRASDPIYELGLIFGGHGQEDRFWEQTLQNLALHFGIIERRVETRVVCIDARRQWRNAGNIWHNAGVRTGIHMMMRAVTWPGHLLKRRSSVVRDQ